MGKRILAQRKGRGVLGFRSPSHRHVGRVKYRPFKEGEEQFKFKVLEFIHSPGRGAPVAVIQYYDTKAKDLWLPPEGIYEGQEFYQTNSMMFSKSIPKTYPKKLIEKSYKNYKRNYFIPTMSKLRNLLFAIPLALSPLISQAQNLSTPQKDQLKTEQFENSKWETTFGTCGIYPHDSDLKDIFGSYFGLEAETQKKINKDFSIGVNGTLGWAKKEWENYKVNLNLTEMSTVALYKLGTEKSKFSIGAGPKISLLKLTGKESGSKANSEKYSGLGYTLRMKYSTKISDKLSLFAKFGYSKIENDNESSLSLGTTNIAVGIQF